MNQNRGHLLRDEREAGSNASSSSSDISSSLKTFFCDAKLSLLCFVILLGFAVLVDDLVAALRVGFATSGSGSIITTSSSSSSSLSTIFFFPRVAFDAGVLVVD